MLKLQLFFSILFLTTCSSGERHGRYFFHYEISDNRDNKGSIEFTSIQKKIISNIVIDFFRAIEKKDFIRIKAMIHNDLGVLIPSSNQMIPFKDKTLNAGLILLRNILWIMPNNLCNTITSDNLNIFIAKNYFDTDFQDINYRYAIYVKGKMLQYVIYFFPEKKDVFKIHHLEYIQNPQSN